jgi:hypothetical protein
MDETKQLAPHIVATPGVWVIEGADIRCDFVAFAHGVMGLPVARLTEALGRTQGELYAALAYHEDHREEIGAGSMAEEGYIPELKRRAPALLEEKLRSLEE